MYFYLVIRLFINSLHESTFFYERQTIEGTVGVFCLLQKKNWKFWQAGLEETTGPEVEDAKKTVADVEKQFPTEDAWFLSILWVLFGVCILRMVKCWVWRLLIVRLSVFFQCYKCFRLLLIHSGDFSLYICLINKLDKIERKMRHFIILNWNMNKS